MYTFLTLIIWSVVALAVGFIAGYLVGLFRWKNSPVKAEAESTAIREGWEQTEARFQAQIDELKKKLEEKQSTLPEEAQGDASKKA